MSVSDKIGLFPIFGWVADQQFFGGSWWSHLLSTLITCWLITPVGHLAFAFIAQATVIPVRRDRQFRSFWPGDFILGGAIALLIFAAGQMDATSERWWQSGIFHAIVLTGAVLVAFAITWLVDRPVMEPTALWSPSKQYHNIVLYGGYGYVAVTSLVAAVAGNGLSPNLLLVLAALAVAVPWVRLVIRDGQMPPGEAKRVREAAHPSEYRLLWVIRVGPRTR